MAIKRKQPKASLDSLDRKLDRVIDIVATKSELQATDRRVGLLEKKADRTIDALVAKADNARFDEFEQRIDARFEQVMSAIDNLAQTISDLAMEYAAVKMQLARHEEWIRLIAKKNGVKLPI